MQETPHWFKFISVADLFEVWKASVKFLLPFFLNSTYFNLAEINIFYVTISISLVFGVQFRNVIGKEVKTRELLRGYR